MNINAEITQNRELKIDVDLSEENVGASGTPNAWVTNIEVFNTYSYLDGISVYSKRFKDYNDPSDTSPAYHNPFVITDHDMNIFDTTVHQEYCHSTDMFNDIIIANVSFGYSPSYQAQSSCCSDTPATYTVVVYYPCPIYDAAIGSMNGCNCNDVCEDNLPYGFMYTLLKKKAIDACIESMHLDQACRYYIKFFKQDSCNCVKKPCGCNGGSTAQAQSTVTITKNCGCHG